jgi:hypothetical protein
VALVVFLRGVNIGGHKTFRPAALAAQQWRNTAYRSVQRRLGREDAAPKNRAD